MEALVVPRLIYKGAEADVLSGSWQGMKVVFKIRKPLPYRHPTLDAKIRLERTVHEGRMLSASKRAGVPAPHVLDLDPEKSTIVMDYIEGLRLKEAASVPGAPVGELFTSLGGEIAKLHTAGIIHGDPTTANAILVGGGKMLLLDFGLSLTSSKVEDRAVDLRLMKETLTGAHHAISSVALSSLFSGYSEKLGESEASKVLRQLASIERRGRYARVD